MTNNRLTHRYIARIGLEAATALFVGSGESSLLTDSLVQKDHNGLPMIPGTALAGVVRHVMEDSLTDTDKITALSDIFGSHNSNSNDDDVGARLLFSHAFMLLGNNKIAEGLNVDIDDNVRQKIEKLPVRDHVRISDKGVNENHGKFDNEVVYKGIRFVCEIELKGTKEDTKFWEELLETIQSPMFRIGQGTRTGYGNLSATVFYNKTFDLTAEKDFTDYLNFNPSLNSIEADFTNKTESKSDKLTHYKLKIKPENTFVFSSGKADEDVDNTPTAEEIMKYENGKIKFVEKTLIPASSIKGALSHRVAFHYNKIKGAYIGSKEAKTGNENFAVNQLFGKGASNETETYKAHRGRLLIDDIYEDADNNKIFNHVAIDRFTGGAIDGALFNEKVSILEFDKEIELNIYVEKSVEDHEVTQALENSLNDICKGLLPLGGMTTKGNGFFSGKYSIVNYE